jgi:hypothetical protein
MRRFRQISLLQRPDFIVFFVVLCVSSAFALYSTRFHHWFLIPVSMCGLLVMREAIDWVMGRRDLYDPLGLFGVYATFFFFFAPLLHVAWDYWMWEVVPPPDWRDWLGWMAVLNITAILAFRASYSFFFLALPLRSSTTSWQIDFRLFPVVVGTALLISALLQAGVYVHLGGLSGYIAAFHTGEEWPHIDPMAGMGPLFMISESFPIVFALACLMYMRRSGKVVTLLQLSVALPCFFALQMLFGGLRGSRLNTVEILFWTVGAVHYLLRRLSRQFMLAGALLMVAFMWAYAFYKEGGDLTTAFEGGNKREEINKTSHRSVQGLILGDFARSDVQAHVLYKWATDNHDFTYGWGRTYLKAAALMVPQRFLPAGAVNKSTLGTELIWGPGTYTPGMLFSTRIYGLAGETILNFGPLPIPLAFACFGFLLSRLTLWIQNLDPNDARMFFVPFLTYLCAIWVVGGDSDNVVFIAIKNGFVSTVIVLMTTVRIRRVRLRTVATLIRREAPSHASAHSC